jgi:hypothetical protein
MSSNTESRAIYTAMDTLPVTSTIVATTGRVYFTDSAYSLAPSGSSYSIVSRLSWLMEEYGKSIAENREEELQVPSEEEQQVGKELIAWVNRQAGEQMQPYAVVDLHGHLQMTMRSSLISVYFTRKSVDTFEVQVFQLGKRQFGHEGFLPAIAARA